MSLLKSVSISCCFLLCYTFALHQKNKRLHEKVLQLQLEREKDNQNSNQNEDVGKHHSGGNSDNVDRNSELVGNKTKTKKTKVAKNLHNDKASDSNNIRSRHFTLEEIGTITSPFPLRAGTPRQGLLAPHSRSILTLHSSIPKETLDDLEQYSHVWIIFQFHLNPIGKGKENVSNKDRSNYVFKSSKIKPPRAHGKKVGLFATRSPHRPNPIGLSLAMIESIEQIEISNNNLNSSGNRNRKRKATIVKLLGLDLVDGTPVYDLKPYLPSDYVDDVSLSIPNYKSNGDDTIDSVKEGCNKGGKGMQTCSKVRTPCWVSNTDDRLASVIWTEEAKTVVYNEQKKGSLSPLYPPIPFNQSSKKNNDQEDEGVQKEMVLNAISEVIAQDPRAQRDGRQQTGSFEITFCTLRVCFIVKKENHTSINSNSSQEQYYALINNVLPDPGDPSAQIGTYQHDLALKRLEERTKS